MLAGIILLLSILVYLYDDIAVLERLDAKLISSSSRIINSLRADALGGIEVDHTHLDISSEFFFQVWGIDKRLLVFSENASDFTSAMDVNGLSVTSPVFNSTVLMNDPYRVLVIPIQVNQQSVGWLQVGVSLIEHKRDQQEILKMFFIADIFLGLIVGGLSWIIISKELKPLEDIANAANQMMSSNDLSIRIPLEPGRNDEIGQVILTLNRTLIRLERIFNSQKRFITDVSHELRTPLTVIKGNIGLGLLMKNMEEESLLTIDKEIDRLTRLVNNLLFIAEAETDGAPLDLKPIEFDGVFLEVYKQLKTLAGSNLVVELAEIDQAQVLGDRDRIKQVLLNLAGNAIKYTPAGGTIKVGLKRVNERACFWISDTGPGIPKKDLSHLFDRFYRGKVSRVRIPMRTGSSFGLGLSIVNWIVRQHKGRIEVESKLGEGTTFTVWLPLMKNSQSMDASSGT